MKKHISSELLNKYLRGECTPQEEARVDEWYSSFNNNQNDERLRNLRDRSNLEKKMLQHIKATIKNADLLSTENADRMGNKKFSTRFFYRAAAAVTFAIAIGLAIYSGRDLLPLFKSPSQSLIIRNASKTITRQSLADGSVIWLQPNSQVEYSAKFSKTTREIALTGEAFFDIAPDRDHPFIITTGNVVTRVLGTSFNIKAYTHSSSIEVSVLTGRVFVAVTDTLHAHSTSVHSNACVLLPHQSATYHKIENSLKTNVVAQLSQLNIWEPKDIIFENVQLRDAILTLEENFNVRIEAANKNVLNCLIRADFTHQNLPDILEMLAKSVEATYEIRGNAIFLNGEGCTSSIDSSSSQ
jgi:transmembrane sensor